MFLICVAAILMNSGNGRMLEELSITLFCLWILAALIVSVQASCLISGERSRQTLDVLLTSPLSGRDIVLEKMQGIRRLTWVLSACFMTIFLFEVWWYASVGFSFRGNYSGLRILSVRSYR